MPGTTSGRYGIDSLSALAMMYDSDAVYRGSVFAFCHTSRKQIRFHLGRWGYWLITRKIYEQQLHLAEFPEADADLIKGSVEMIKRFCSAGYSKKDFKKVLSSSVIA